ncbi:hypothetical protein MMYC01_203224 [Madurella mycetomatis]|uniref:Uncharacterized protein n=1 Tax=Madurella mycetomatis TaxID=100816 RepID=A0A175W7I8_9PEZI|nr:hypothetical protein MMYC01_203224 [Madurella mycetomatis]
MCDFDEFIFTCGHSTFRLKCHCHYARNHPQHWCNKVKKLRNSYDQTYECDECAEARRRQEAAYYYSQAQGMPSIILCHHGPILTLLAGHGTQK